MATSPSEIATKARRLVRGLLSNGPLYPALRSRPATERAPRDAFVELGFAPAEVEAHERDYERAAGEAFPHMLERARAVGAELPARKLAQPDLPAHEGKKLLYLAVRLSKPEAIVETGTFNGTYTTFLLLGLRDNGRGRLVSLDLPARAAIEHAIDHPLPPGQDPGWIVPDELRDRVEFVHGDSKSTLQPVLDRLGAIDLFFHDSLHTTDHMLFEYRAAWKHLRPGGLLLSDDAFMTPALWWFTRRRRLPFLHTGDVGLTRKP